MEPRYAEKKEPIDIALCICLLGFGGCGQKEGLSDSESVTFPEYQEDSLVFRLPGEHCPFTLLGASDTHFYYYHRWTEESEGEYSDQIAFYRQALEKGSEPACMDLSAEDMLLRSACIFTDSAGEDIVYLLFGEEKDGELRYSIAGYDTDGGLLEKIALQDTAVAGDYPKAFLRLQDGGFAVITSKYCLVTDAHGETLFSLPCPGTEFRGLVELPGEKVGVSYAERDARDVSLAIVDRDGETMSQGTVITGDGNRLCRNGETVVYADEGAICQYDPATGIAYRAVSLEGRNIDIHQIADIHVSGNAFHLLGYSTDMAAVKYITYQEGSEEETPQQQQDPEKYDAYGRRYLYLYDFTGEWPTDATNPIDAFNEQSDSYQVVLKDYQYGDAYGYDVAKIVASGDYPDLIFSSYNSLIASFREKGVLEDIAPYIEHSENLSLEDMSQHIVAAYTDQGKIFALPNQYRLGAFWGDREQMGQAGWTVDAFLDWLSEDPNAGQPLFSTPKAIYDACIPAVLETCIDRQSGKASFESDAFRSFITKLKALERKESVSRDELVQMLAEMEGSPYCLYDGVTLSTIAREEKDLGRELAIKGYPSADGEPLAYIKSPALSILSTSEDKEGAYEFLEFYLLYMNDSVVQAMDKGVSGLWIIDEYVERNIEALLQADENMGAMCTYSERQIDEVLNTIPYAVLKDYSQTDLEELIWEDLESLLTDHKDADTVCGIIQSKVQLYLDEHGDD